MLVRVLTCEAFHQGCVHRMYRSAASIVLLRSALHGTCRGHGAESGPLGIGVQVHPSYKETIEEHELIRRAPMERVRPQGPTNRRLRLESGAAHSLAEK